MSSLVSLSFDMSGHLSFHLQFLLNKSEAVHRMALKSL